MTKNPSLPFAAKVHARMRERGLGLREFCRAVRLDPSFFSKVLAGKRSPPSDETDLRRIADILQLDAPDLIVAAGRIPSEWRRLWNDDALFNEVHRLAAGMEPPSARRETGPASRDVRESARAPGGTHASGPAGKAASPLPGAGRVVRREIPAERAPRCAVIPVLRPGGSRELGEELL